MFKSIDTELKLKVFYAVIAIIEIPIGILMLVAPEVYLSIMGGPSNQDPLLYGVAASI